VLGNRGGNLPAAGVETPLLGCTVIRRDLALIGIPFIVALALSGCGGKSSNTGSGSGSSGGGATSVSISAGATSVDGSDSTTLTAAVANDNNNLGVSWSLTGGGSLSNQSTTSVTYTAPTATSSSVTVTVTATSRLEETRLATAQITVPPVPSVTSTNSGFAGAVGSAYSAQLAGTNGVAPYTWSVASGSNLPAGLTLSPSGLVSGTPLAGAGGSTNVIFQLKDSGTPVALTATKTITLAITPAPTISFAGTMPATGSYNQTYSGSAAASGGLGGLTYSVISGALPTGLTLNAATGAVAGTITAAGTFNFTIRAADIYGDSGTHTYQIVVVAPTLIVTPGEGALSLAITGQAYSQTLTVSGGTGIGYTWVVSGLSNGLTSLASGATLTINGPATTAGTVNFSVTATDSVGDTSSPLPYSIQVNGPLALPVTIPATLPAIAAVGVPYAGTVTATGGSGNYAWTVTGQSDGLTTSTNGGTLSVTGTPTASGTVSLSVSVKDPTSGTTVGPYVYAITVYSGVILPAPNPVSLPGGYINIPYTGSITASGGSGNYSWQLTGLSDNLISASSGGTLTISGTPGSTPVTVTFNVKLTDTSTHSTVTQNGYTIAIATPTPVSLPAPNPTTLPQGTLNEAYTGSIVASGGVPPYTWSINGASIPNTGSLVAVADGLSVSNNGTNTLSVSGTPTAIQTVNLTNVKVSDSLGSTQTVSYTINVYRMSQITGQVSLSAACGTSTPAVPTITVTLLSKPGNTVVQTTTTDSSGNFTFPSVYAGSYTISPSITGPSSVFYPTTQSATVSNTDANGIGFTVALGYTVSGSVGYSGSNTGQIYLALVPATPCGPGGLGTSIFTPGSFSIRGVPPGSYTLQAWMDLTALGNGAQNTSDPSGSIPVAVVSSDLTGQSVTIADNTPTAVPSANPVINAITPTDQGLAISYKAVTTNGVEAATSYDVQWSTDSTFATGTTAHNFKAVGTGSNVWILNNGTAGVTGNPFTNGQTYYVEARARNAAGPASGWQVYNLSGTPIGITAGASTSGNEVQGTVTIPSGVTPTGPLYVGYYNQSTNTVYGTRIASPGSSNAFTVYVPTDTNNDYVLFEILDQNNDGLIDAGDVTNTGQNNVTPIAISGPLTGQNLTLATANSTVTVGTQYFQYNAGTSSTGYNLNFDVREGNKLPVAVTLMSGPNVINPVDISNYCNGCGNVQFQYYVPLNGNTPNVGDAYTFKITYSDSSTDTETLTGSVTGWNGTTTLVGANEVATNMLPNDQESLKPTFLWNVPSVDTSDIFSFYLYDPNNNVVWQIPGANSNSNGLSSSITSLNWGIDPTDPNNDLTPGFALTSQTVYSWDLSARDIYGNQALSSVAFQASGFL